MASTDKVKEVVVNTNAELHDHFTWLQTELALPETEHTWERLRKAIERLHGITKGKAYKFDDYIKLLKTIMKPITNCILTERSKLCGTACEFIGSLAPRLAERFEPLVIHIVPSLLQLCARPNIVAYNHAERALTKICEKCMLPSLVPFLRDAAKDKGHKMRFAAVQCLAQLLRAAEPARFVKRAPDIEACIQGALPDANPEVRTQAKDLFVVYAQMWPDRVPDFTSKLTPVTKKRLPPTMAAPARPPNELVASGTRQVKPALARSVSVAQVPDQAHRGVAPESSRQALFANRHEAGRSHTAHGAGHSDEQNAKRPAGHPAGQGASKSQRSVSGPVDRDPHSDDTKPQSAAPTVRHGPSDRLARLASATFQSTTAGTKNFATLSGLTGNHDYTKYVQGVDRDSRTALHGVRPAGPSAVAPNVRHQQQQMATQYTSRREGEEHQRAEAHSSRHHITALASSASSVSLSTSEAQARVSPSEGVKERLMREQSEQQNRQAERESQRQRTPPPDAVSVTKTPHSKASRVQAPMLAPPSRSVTASRVIRSQPVESAIAVKATPVNTPSALTAVKAPLAAHAMTVAPPTAASKSSTDKVLAGASKPAGSRSASVSKGPSSDQAIAPATTRQTKAPRHAPLPVDNRSAASSATLKPRSVSSTSVSHPTAVGSSKGFIPARSKDKVASSVSASQGSRARALGNAKPSAPSTRPGVPTSRKPSAAAEALAQAKMAQASRERRAKAAALTSRRAVEGAKNTNDPSTTQAEPHSSKLEAPRPATAVHSRSAAVPTSSPAKIPLPPSPEYIPLTPSTPGPRHPIVRLPFRRVDGNVPSPSVRGREKSAQLDADADKDKLSDDPAKPTKTSRRAMRVRLSHIVDDDSPVAQKTVDVVEAVDEEDEDGDASPEATDGAGQGSDGPVAEEGVMTAEATAQAPPSVESAVETAPSQLQDDSISPQAAPEPTEEVVQEERQESPPHALTQEVPESNLPSKEAALAVLSQSFDIVELQAEVSPPSPPSAMSLERERGGVAEDIQPSAELVGISEAALGEVENVAVDEAGCDELRDENEAVEAEAADHEGEEVLRALPTDSEVHESQLHTADRPQLEDDTLGELEASMAAAGEEEDTKAEHELASPSSSSCSSPCPAPRAARTSLSASKVRPSSPAEERDSPSTPETEAALAPNSAPAQDEEVEIAPHEPSFASSTSSDSDSEGEEQVILTRRAAVPTKETLRMRTRSEPSAERVQEDLLDEEQVAPRRTTRIRNPTAA